MENPALHTNNTEVDGAGNVSGVSMAAFFVSACAGGKLIGEKKERGVTSAPDVWLEAPCLQRALTGVGEYGSRLVWQPQSRGNDSRPRLTRGRKSSGSEGKAIHFVLAHLRLARFLTRTDTTLTNCIHMFDTC